MNSHLYIIFLFKIKNMLKNDFYISFYGWHNPVDLEFCLCHIHLLNVEFWFYVLLYVLHCRRILVPT